MSLGCRRGHIQNRKQQFLDRPPTKQKISALWEEGEGTGPSSCTTRGHSFLPQGLLSERQDPAREQQDYNRLSQNLRKLKGFEKARKTGERS